jgi:hypothetical protein
MQNKIYKGSFVLVIACLLLSFTSSAYGIDSDNIHTPFVLNANKVPVVGGSLSIYGFNFGEDPSVIRVYVVDTNTGHSIPCFDVEIILPNSIIACTIADVGTGRDKRIEVNVNGVSNAFTEDDNTVFSRIEPIMEILSYNDEGSIIYVHGSNFGEDTSVVSVSVDGFDHIVTYVNDSFITCNKHADYQLPDSSNADVSKVTVTVDGQQSIANMTFVSINDVMLAVTQPEEDLVTADPASESKPRDNMLLIVGLIVGGVGAVLAIAGFLVVKKRKFDVIAKAQRQQQASESGNAPAAAPTTQQQGGGAIVLQRDHSFEEIDLNDDLLKARNFYDPKAEYDYSSTSSSFSSPYSSTNASPYTASPYTASPFTASPESVRRAAAEKLPKSSMSTSTHSHKKSKIDYETVHTPNSRLSKKSLDSPYFTKQNAFDSPLGGSSQDVTPSIRTPHHPSSLNSSQEIDNNNPNACVFDSPSVLHTVMARAAMLRTREQHKQPQQQQQQQQQVQPSHSPSAGKPPLYNVERRASLGAPLHPPLGRRRSSLGISSLHLSALHSSFGIAKQKQQIKLQQQQQQQQQQRHLPLNVAQVIEIPDAE